MIEGKSSSSKRHPGVRQDPGAADVRSSVLLEGRKNNNPSVCLMEARRTWEAVAGRSETWFRWRLTRIRNTGPIDRSHSWVILIRFPGPGMCHRMARGNEGEKETAQKAQGNSAKNIHATRDARLIGSPNLRVFPQQVLKVFSSWRRKRDAGMFGCRLKSRRGPEMGPL